ncbi:MAG TPA: SEC-C domain-containing protein, partial [Cellvibrio sp.]|nr:SEC-C domain-containing protein [Cellvibrio sp.]
FKLNQKVMSESAFFEILSDQFQGAAIYQEVYYRDLLTNQWVENDTLIVIDDVLILVEAKSGAAATIASPELDYSRHTQAIQDLIIKAYRQCKRFFEYLNTGGDKSIYKLEGGRYTECGKLNRAAYRVMIPVGLTVESFSPFSSMSKELPEIEPLLGKYPFISLSIDDLFVLKRFLPTMGQLAHYLEVRQTVSGIKGALLFDEHDHLGAYISRNRFDVDIQQQQDEGSPDLITWTGMSEIVDSYFKGDDWSNRPIPTQEFPDSVSNLLSALDKTRKQGWLSIDSQIRDAGADGRNDLGNMLLALIATLDERPYRYFLSLGDPALFIWLQQSQMPCDILMLKNRAAAVGLANGLNYMNGVVASVDPSGAIYSAERVEIEIPTSRTEQNYHLYEESERIVKNQMAKRASVKKPIPNQRLGRNEKCWCGSELKYKKCHGK